MSFESFDEDVKKRTLTLLSTKGYPTIPEECKEPIRVMLQSALTGTEGSAPSEVPHYIQVIAERQANDLISNGETLADHPGMDPDIRGEVIMIMRDALRMLDGPFISCV